MKLNVRTFAYSCGILYGLYFFLSAVFASTGVWVPFLNFGVVEMTEDMLVGYSATIGGAFVGLVYGFLGGGIMGGVLAWLYNKLS